MTDVIVVKAVRDADVWLVESADVAGLRLEGETLEELAEKLPGAILTENGCQLLRQGRQSVDGAAWQTRITN